MRRAFLFTHVFWGSDRYVKWLCHRTDQYPDQKVILRVIGGLGMRLFIRRQTYRRAPDLAIFFNTLNQWWDDQERYWQHGSRFSNTLLGAKQLTGNLPRLAKTHVDWQMWKIKTIGQSAINTSWTACIWFRSEISFLQNFQDTTPIVLTIPHQSSGLACEAQLVPQNEHFDRNLLRLDFFFSTKK